MTREIAQPNRVLMVFAHADDETLLAGALIAKFVSDGCDVSVLCVAPGSDDRTKRLHRACADLGVNRVETLRFIEGEMWPQKPETGSDPLTASRVATAPLADISGRISGRMLEFDPDLVVTHAPYGDYGHADHAAVYRATVTAVEGAPEDLRGKLSLYALDWPSWAMRINTLMLRLARHNTHEMGHDGGFDLIAAVNSTRGQRISFQVGSFLGVRRNASRHYGPEIADGPLVLRFLEKLPAVLQRPVLGNVRVRRIY